MASDVSTPPVAVSRSAGSPVAPQRSSRRSIAAIPTWSRALAFYLIMGLLTIGWHALSHPTTVCACLGTGDSAAYMWGLSWWPHAIAHGLNPFVTHYLWSPTGVNVAQAAMIPTAAIAMAPVTALAGSFVSYNILSIASPVLSALTAYLLCRRLVHRELPAVAGGYLFGFSSYEFVQLTGHLNLTLVFLIPVMVHIVLRRVDREISRRAYLIGMALLLVLQAGLSTELLAVSIGFGAVLLVSARCLAPPPQRWRISGLIGETIAAGILALVLGAPFFYYAILSGGLQSFNAAYWDIFGLDFLNLFFPTATTWLGHYDFQSLGGSYEIGSIMEADGYLGTLLIAAFMLWVFRAKRESPVLVRLLLIAASLGLVVTLGAHLHIAGHQTVTLPFAWIDHLPVLANLVPSRMALFTTLAISIGVAAWLAMTTGRVIGRWLVVLLAAVMIFPNVTRSIYGVSPPNPRFFSSATYRRYLRRGETVLILPFGAGDQSTFWQAETGFYFYMPGGYVSNFVPPSFNSPVVDQLIHNNLPSIPELGSFIRQHSVSHVVVDLARAGSWPGVMAQLGFHGQAVGGVLLYAVPDAPA